MGMGKYMPEAQTIEYKSPWHDDYYGWISGYANAGGGSIYIGVNDDGYVMGLKNSGWFLDELPNLVSSILGITVSIEHATANRGANIKYGSVPDDIAMKPENLYVRGILTEKAIMDIDVQPDNTSKVTKEVQDLFDAAQGFVKQLRGSGNFRAKVLEDIRIWNKENPVNISQGDLLEYVKISVDAYSYGVSYRGHFYKRSGGTTKELQGAELALFLLEKAGKTWDSLPVKNFTPSHEALDFLRGKAVEKDRLSESAANVSDRTLVENLGMLTDEGEYTRAAAMLFGDPVKVAPGAYIKVGYFAPVGTRGMNLDTDVLYDDVIKGPLIMQADKAVETIYQKYFKGLISYKGLHQKKAYPVPLEAMREIILNAIVHKSYGSGNPIQVRVYDDHVTVMNEGAWPFTKIAPEDVYTEEHSSYRANPLIAEAFFTLGEIETWGRGFEKIRMACERDRTPLPEVKAMDGSVTIFIHASENYMKLLRYGQYGEVGADGVIRTEPDKLNEDRDVPENVEPRIKAYIRMQEVLSNELKEREKKIFLPLVEYYETHDEITTATAAEITGKSEKSAYRYLKKLVDLGVVVQEGQSHNTVYRLSIE